MEKLLGRMRPIDQQMIKRIALQQYTQGETAAMLRISLRNCLRGYGQAVDRLTEMLIAAGMLEPLKSCQEGETRLMEVSSSLWTS
jgi:DNA-directed RNA polymerase specialized sigma24 family protein